MKNIFKDFYNAYEKYMKTQVIKNEYAIRPCFHNLIGVILPNLKIMEGGYYDTRLHIFLIQDSSTGKGQIAKAQVKIIEYLKEKIALMRNSNTISLPKYTDARLLGGLGKKGMDVEGVLKTHRFICWEEASILCREKMPHMETVRDILNLAMDNDRWLGSGTLSSAHVQPYKTDASIFLTSVWTDDIRRRLLEGGFMQRLFIICNEITVPEKDEMLDGIIKRWGSDINGKVNPLLKDLKKHASHAIGSLELKKKELEDKTGQKLPYYYLKPENDKIEKIIEKERKSLREGFRGQFSDSRQKVLETFTARSIQNVKKIATQHAFLSAKDTVDLESVEYALEVVKIHRDSIIKILEYTGKGKERISDEILLIQKLNDFERQNKQITKVAFVNSLLSMSSWNLSFKKTIQLVNELISKGKIKVEVGSHNKHYLKPN
jgi:hypothetical protein